MGGFNNEIMYSNGIQLQNSVPVTVPLMQQVSTDVSLLTYVGNPNNVISANPSSISHDPSTGFLWLKVSGTGTTLWKRLFPEPSASVVTLTGNTGGAIPPDGVGNINVIGAGALSFAGSGNTLTGSITGGGLVWLDASGAFAAAANTGYFLTAASTPTLPLAPAQGTIIEFAVVATATMTITANAGQFIVLDGATSAAAGTAVAGTIGNTIRLVYRTVGTTWFAIAANGASWTIT